MKTLLWLLLVGFLWSLIAPAVWGDEGMWLFNNPPRKYLKEKHNFNISDDWLTHVQRSSVRFNSGGSGSFVSANGLVMTNHHVGADALQKLGTKDKDYLRDGFHAKSHEEELKCDGMELNVLISIEDVTERVNASTKDLPPEKAFAARRGAMAEIEKESLEKYKLRSDVVTLYQGGQYHLYRFKKYTDVRLVFAPEQQAAFFGGDPDNFEYPRYCLDVAFFRVYEDDKPAKLEHYLKWSKKPIHENDLVFVSGHPGRTSRLNTVAELEYLRDTGYPFLMQRLYRLESVLSEFSARSQENGRQAKDFLFSVQNSRKARKGGLAGLLDPNLMARKKEEERRLREEAERNDDLVSARTAWDRIAEAQKVRAQNIRKYTLLEGSAAFRSDLFGIARTLLRASQELPKPNNDRLREFSEAGLDSLKLQLFSDDPIYQDYEIVKLTESLIFFINEMGYDDPLVKKVLEGKSPSERATELVKGSKLKDVAVRKSLFEGGQKAVEDAKDPMIELARLVDADSRAVREIMETNLQEVSRQAYADIAKVKFALEGTDTYPDATFTLRLAFGVVKGYEERGQKVPFQTVYSGLYERAKENENKSPFDLSPIWEKKKAKLNLEAPINFVCTADIIGGNSGSPVLNRDAEVVGLIFDGNIQSLVLDFAFTEEQARATSVHSEGILEALRSVYEADNLVAELTK